MRRAALLILILTCGSLRAQARIFDIKNETVAGYLTFDAGSSSLGKSPFQDEAATGLSYDDEYKYNYGGEFGFLYATPGVNFRFGLEVIAPPTLKGVKVSNGSGELYSVRDDVLVFTPRLSMELNLKKGQMYRMFLIGAVGAANLTLKHDYTFTTAGQSAYPGVDQSMEAKGNAAEVYGGAGLEVNMSDTTMFMAEAGYRRLKFNKLTYSKDVITFAGTQHSGDTVKDVNGEDRSLDLSGLLLRVGFRFYL